MISRAALSTGDCSSAPFLRGINQGGPKIVFVFAAEGRTVPGDVVVGFLQTLDIAPARNNESRFAELFDAWWDPERGGWTAWDAELLVKVTCLRSCFLTSPSATESVDVYLPVSAFQDIAHEDPDRAYLALNHYRNQASLELRRLGYWDNGRQGFSSWCCVGDVVLVKVVGRSADYIRRGQPGVDEAAADVEAGSFRSR